MSQVHASIQVPDKRDTIRSISESIHGLANTVLYSAGFRVEAIKPQEIVEIFRFLEDCKEEGRALFPEVLVAEDLDKCLEQVRPVRKVVCGECDGKQGRVKRALKRCAAIAVEPWVVFLEVTSGKLRYGLATKDVRAGSQSIVEELLSTNFEEAGVPLLVIQRYGSKALSIRSSKSQEVVSLTLSDELLEQNRAIASFAKAVSGKLSDEERRIGAERLVFRLLQRACREGHGFISCTVSGDAQSLERCSTSLRDGAWLKPALELYSEAVDPSDVSYAMESDSSLRARIALAHEMIKMDLMTVFSTDCKLLGYNVHIPSPQGDGESGGARSRAFTALSSLDFVGAAIMCSQDGRTVFIEKSHV